MDPPGATLLWYGLAAFSGGFLPYTFLVSRSGTRRNLGGLVRGVQARENIGMVDTGVSQAGPVPLALDGRLIAYRHYARQVMDEEYIDGRACEFTEYVEQRLAEGRLRQEAEAEAFGAHRAITVRLLAEPSGEAIYEIIGGHHDVEAARRARLPRVYAWILELDDEAADLEHARHNHRASPPSPLEVGLHAYSIVVKDSKKGLSMAAYGRAIGKGGEWVRQLWNAAEVVRQSQVDLRLQYYEALHHKTQQLNAAHAAPRQDWPRLVDWIACDPGVSKIVIQKHVELVEETRGIISRSRIPADTASKLREEYDAWLSENPRMACNYRHLYRRRDFIKDEAGRAAAISAMRRSASTGGETASSEAAGGNGAGREATGGEADSVSEAQREASPEALAGQADEESEQARKAREAIEQLPKPGEPDYEGGVVLQQDASIMPRSNFAAEQFKVAIIDPPYGKDYRSASKRIDYGLIANDLTRQGAARLFREVVRATYPQLTKDAYIFVYCEEPIEHLFKQILRRAGFTFRHSLIWDKLREGQGDFHKGFRPSHERILYAVKGDPQMLYINSSDVLRYTVPTRAERVHQTEKSVELEMKLIEATTLPGYSPHQSVLAPMCGSGTTLVAAKKLGRTYVGFEIDENNYRIAASRLEATRHQESLEGSSW